MVLKRWPLPIRLHRYLFATTRYKKFEIETLISAGNVSIKRIDDEKLITENLLPTTYIFPGDQLFVNKLVKILINGKKIQEFPH